MTPDDYYAFNQANARVQPVSFAAPVTHEELRARNMQRHGYDGTYADGNRLASVDARRDGWRSAGIFASLFGGPAAYSALTRGASAAASGAAAGATRAAASGGMLSKISTVANSPGMNLGVNAALSLLGMRSQTKANDRARQELQSSQAAELALARHQLETEARNADLDRADARALNDAINELKRRELAAQEEERAYLRARDIDERAYTRGRETARDQRLEPYRQISRHAADRLMGLWS